MGSVVKFWLFLSLKKKKKVATDITQAHLPDPAFNALAICGTIEHAIFVLFCFPAKCHCSSGSFLHHHAIQHGMAMYTPHL